MRRLLVVGITALALVGCSSISSQLDLAKNDQWDQIGKMDGMAGYHMKSVPELMRLGNVAGDALDQYKRGYQVGIEEYCQPEKAMMRGTNGRPYKGQCAGTSNEERVVKKWLKGYDHYRLEQEIADINKFGEG